MEAFGKTVRGLCSIPFFGGLIALLIGLLPLLLLFPFINDGNKFMLTAVGGILVALWSFFLAKKEIIKIVAPVVPVPFWGLGVVISVLGVYQHFMGAL